MDVKVGLERKLSTKELMLLNCGVGEDFVDAVSTRCINLMGRDGEANWNI